MHAEPPAHAAAPSSGVGQMLPRKRRATAGFSLVEVTLAIGIIAFAFVALLGLLPTGLQVFRESIDTSNEMWIVQDLNSLIQVTPWSEVEKMKDFTFYYDEEGRLTDRESGGGGGGATSTSPELAARRLYAVKLVFGEPVRPGESTADNTTDASFGRNVLRTVVVFAQYNRPKAMQEFAKIKNVDDVQNLAKNSGVKTRCFVVSRMDSLREVAP